MASGTLDNLKFRFLLIFFLLGIHTALGAVIFQSADALPQDIKYDFVVAGGGTAGLLVASRLAKNARWNILVVEAGPSDKDFFETLVPGFWTNLEKTPIDWNYTTIPQRALNDRIIDYSRGFLLGGCSTHNTQLYTRGSRDDWNRYAELGGNDALRWDNILQVLMKEERWTQDIEDQNEAGHRDPAVHGTKGQLFVQAPYSEHPFNDLIGQLNKDSAEFPFTRDTNDGRPIGTGWNQCTIGPNSERSSAVSAFLNATGKNVHVLLNNLVTRVLRVHPSANEFRVVEVAANAQSRRKQILAEKEVILSGGIFGSPQILLSSGIGKRDELEAVGIQTLIDNPSVGKNLSDQPAILANFSTKIQDTDFDAVAALREWNDTRTGPLTRPIAMDHITFMRLPDDAPPFSKEGFPDPTAGKDTPHIEFLWLQITGSDTASSNSALQIYVFNLHPISRGSVVLKTSNPFDHPAIDIGLLTEQVDLSILREAIRNLRKLLSTPVFRGSVFGSTFPPANVTSDEDLEIFLREATALGLHGVGSASMSPKGAGWGVVDPDFSVKGTKGLRVVDASVIPFTPSGHTQVSVYGFAEIAGQMIIEKWD